MNRLFCVVIAALFASTASAQTPASARATWALLVEHAESDQLIKPEPISDICETCNGTGRLGDGTIERTCPDCNGTGKRTRSAFGEWEPADLPPKQHALVEIYSRNNCPHCDDLKRLIPGIEKQGWQVVVHEDSTGVVPRSQIWVNGRSHVVIGYAGSSRYFRSMQNAIKLSSSAAKTVRDDYRPRWTFPGDLYNHLLGPPHLIDTASWTQDQRERFHDDWHDRFGN